MEFKKQVAAVRASREAVWTCRLDYPLDPTPEAMTQLTVLRGEAQKLALECYIACEKIRRRWELDTAHPVRPIRSAAELLGDLL